MIVMMMMMTILPGDHLAQRHAGGLCGVAGGRHHGGTGDGTGSKIKKGFLEKLMFCFKIRSSGSGPGSGAGAARSC